MAKNTRLDKLFGQQLVHGPEAQKLRLLSQQIPPAARQLMAGAIRHYEKQLEDLKEALDDREDQADKLRLTQKVLIVALQKMGGSLTLYAGQLNEVPDGSVVKVDKLERGEGNSVPLMISWYPPGTRVATTDIRPGS